MITARINVVNTSGVGMLPRQRISTVPGPRRHGASGHGFLAGRGTGFGTGLGFGSRANNA